MLWNEGKPHLAQQMHDYVGLVRYAPPELVLKPVQPMPAEFCRETAATLKSLTGMNWQVTTSDGPAEPSLLEQEQAADAEAKQAVMDSSEERAVGKECVSKCRSRVVRYP